MRDAGGHVDLRRLGPRLALAAVAREQRAADQALRRAAPGLRWRAHLSTVMDALVVTLPRSELERLGGRARREAGVAGRHLPRAGRDIALAAAAQTDRVPAVVGAPALWSGLDGGLAAAGDGMRIGIIDDGIDMTRPSFAGAGYRYPPGFPKGFHASTNGKIIVARAFAPPRGSKRMRTAFDPDGSEHGTHVAGIAAGLSGITGTSLGVTINGLSGVAPHAYLGSYRVLTIPTPSFGLDGNGPEIARAIDRAVSDGMDVLNLSLGEPEVESANDVVARAIHGAARAGVVTVVAAGNSGDDLGSGSISSPGSAADAITVAATSVGRFVGVTLAVLGPGAVPADLGAFGAATDAPDQIPPGWKAGVPLVVTTDCGGGRAGALVLVQLGARCTASRADSALAAGALGIVYAQHAAGDPTAVDDEQQRSLTVSDLVGARLAQQAVAAGGELTLSVDNASSEQISSNSGLIASFSSRGPSPYSLALKPDVAAPGVDIVSPIPGGYGTWSGTSMATPAVAGAVALLRERHPTWTPAQIKSALVLTGRPVFNDTKHLHPTTVLAQGGGMIDVQAADAPGLFAAPSGISFGLLRAGRSETRKIELSDAGGGGGTWSVAAPGLDAPGTLTVPAGGSQSLEVTLSPPGRSVERQPHRERRADLGGRTRCTSAGGATSSARIWPGSTPARWPPGAGSRAIRARAPKSSIATAGRPARRAAACRASIRAASSCGRSRCRPARATRASSPRVASSRRSCSRATRTGSRVSRRCPEQQSVPRDLRPLREGERRCSCLPRGRYFVSVETRPGHKPGAYRLRLWIDDRRPPVDQRGDDAVPALRRRAALPRD